MERFLGLLLMIQVHYLQVIVQDHLYLIQPLVTVTSLDVLIHLQ